MRSSALLVPRRARRGGAPISGSGAQDLALPRRCELEPPLLEPVAQAPVAEDVVAVVARDPAQDLRAIVHRRVRPSSSQVSNATMLEPASFSPTSRLSAYRGSMRLIE